MIGVNAIRIGDPSEALDWYDVAELVEALNWPGFADGFDDLDDYEMRDDFVDWRLVTAYGAMSLVAKQPERVGDLLELLVRAHVCPLRTQQ